MNKKMQKITSAGLALLVGSGLFVTSVDAASLTKSLKAVYNNIKVSYDGQTATPNMEPFMVDGTVYVSLRDAGEITGNKVDWRNNTVHITPGAGSVDQSALDQKQREVDFWKTKADALEKQLNELKAQGGTDNGGTIVKPGDTAAMEKRLVELFDEEYSVAWDFDIKQHSTKNMLYVTVSYSSKSDKKDFENITSKKLNSLLTDVSMEIQKVFKDFSIEGTLEDDYKDEIIGSFTYSTKGSFAYSKAITRDDIRELEKTLNSSSAFKKLPALKLGEETVQFPVTGITLEYKDEEIIYKINTTVDAKYRGYWNDLSEYTVEDAFEYFLDDIEYEIGRDVDFDIINGYIINDGSTMVKFEDGDFRKSPIY